MLLVLEKTTKLVLEKTGSTRIHRNIEDYCSVQGHTFNIPPIKFNVNSELCPVPIMFSAKQR